jgi:hypothetical protein
VTFDPGSTKCYLKLPFLKYILRKPSAPHALSIDDEVRWQIIALYKTLSFFFNLNHFLYNFDILNIRQLVSREAASTHIIAPNKQSEATMIWISQQVLI